MPLSIGLLVAIWLMRAARWALVSLRLLWCGDGGGGEAGFILLAEAGYFWAGLPVAEQLFAALGLEPWRLRDRRRAVVAVGRMDEVLPVLSELSLFFFSKIVPGVFR